MASERYSERVQKITREGGAGSMEKPKIAFDVDGVLGDFLYQYSRYHKKIYPDSGIDFRMITDYGVPATCGILWSLPGFYESMPVMEGAKELVREFAEVCEIHCVTATPAFAKKVRKDWLLQQFPEIEESRIHFVDACDKQAFCIHSGIDLLVDDCPETCLSFPPEKVYVFRWEYNKNLKDMGYKVGRFADLRGVLG